MGFTAARKAAAILANTRHVIAIEGLAAAQGLDMRAPLQPAAATGAAVAVLRDTSPYLAQDRPLADDIEGVAQLITDGALSAAVERVTGPLN
jgi:histidine ammonia-lyase